MQPSDSRRTPLFRSRVERLPLVVLLCGLLTCPVAGEEKKPSGDAEAVQRHEIELSLKAKELPAATIVRTVRLLHDPELDDVTAVSIFQGRLARLGLAEDVEVLHLGGGQVAIKGSKEAVLNAIVVACPDGGPCEIGTQRLSETFEFTTTDSSYTFLTALKARICATWGFEVCTDIDAGWQDNYAVVLAKQGELRQPGELKFCFAGDSTPLLSIQPSGLRWILPSGGGERTLKGFLTLETEEVNYTYLEVFQNTILDELNGANAKTTLTTRVVKLNYLETSSAVALLSGMPEFEKLKVLAGPAASVTSLGNEEGAIVFDEETATADLHTLVLRGPKSTVESAVKFLHDSVDVPAKQVAIQALIIEISEEGRKNLGLQTLSVSAAENQFRALFEGDPLIGSGSFEEWDVPVPSGTATKSRKDTFAAKFQAQVDDGNVTIKASPKVIALDGRQSRLAIVRRVPVEKTLVDLNGDLAGRDFEYEDIGITLDIKPRVVDDNSEVQLQVEAIVSTLQEVRPVTPDGFLLPPDIDTRNITTVARVGDQEPLIIGGLIQSQDEEREFGIPILKEIPILRDVFRRTETSTESREVIIVIIPQIIQERGSSGSPGGSSKRWPRSSTNLFVPADLRNQPQGSDFMDSADTQLEQGYALLRISDFERAQKVDNTISAEPVIQRAIHRMHLLDVLGVEEGETAEEEPESEGARSEADVIREIIHVNDLFDAGTNPEGRTTVRPGLAIWIPTSHDQVQADVWDTYEMLLSQEASRDRVERWIEAVMSALEDDDAWLDLLAELEEVALASGDVTAADELYVLLGEDNRECLALLIVEALDESQRSDLLGTPEALARVLGGLSKEGVLKTLNGDGCENWNARVAALAPETQSSGEGVDD